MKKLDIAPNVQQFLRRAGSIVGSFHQDRFESDSFSFLSDHQVESPIEQLLYMAMEALREVNYISSAQPMKIDGEWRAVGLYIQPQYEVGKYRVDFIVSFESVNEKRQVVVECDSQKFHDRTEPERRYEKERDRFLQASGYTVFRFTGSEIVKNPFKVAAEILAHVIGYSKDELLDFIDSIEES